MFKSRCSLSLSLDGLTVWTVDCGVGMMEEEMLLELNECSVLLGSDLEDGLKVES